jgi:hypothetical protein
LPSASVPRRGRPSAASTAPAAGKKSTTGALVAQTESLTSNSFALYLVAPLIEVARGAFRVVLVRGVVPEEGRQAVLESRQHMPDKADHGLRHFIEVGVDQVRQSSASSFEARPVKPTRSQNMTVSGGVHERWLRGAQSPRVNSELPNLTRQSTPRRAGADLDARSPFDPVRKKCAMSGRRRFRARVMTPSALRFQ